MNFKKYLNLILTVFVCSNRVLCTTKVDMPMVDNMDAPLKASFDISVLNQEIKDIIKEEVKHGIEQAMDAKAEKIAERKLNESIDIFNSRLSNAVAVFRHMEKIFHRMYWSYFTGFFSPFRKLIFFTELIPE